MQGQPDSEDMRLWLYTCYIKGLKETNNINNSGSNSNYYILSTYYVTSAMRKSFLAFSFPISL